MKEFSISIQESLNSVYKSHLLQFLLFFMCSKKKKLKDLDQKLYRPFCLVLLRDKLLKEVYNIPSRQRSKSSEVQTIHYYN